MIELQDIRDEVGVESYGAMLNASTLSNPFSGNNPQYSFLIATNYSSLHGYPGYLNGITNGLLQSLVDSSVTVTVTVTEDSVS